MSRQLASLSRRHCSALCSTVSIALPTRESRLKRTYWWQGIGEDVARWTKSCEACQKSKVHKHTKAPLERLPPPTKRFSHIHVDLVGPLNPACEGKNTLLTVIDRWTGWPEAFPMTTHGDAANTKACARCWYVSGSPDGVYQTS